MKNNIKDNVWIEGFYSERLCKNKFWYLVESNELSVKYGSGKEITIIYCGEISEIPEEVIKEYSPYHKNKKEIIDYCDQPYCIIYKY